MVWILLDKKFYEERAYEKYLHRGSESGNWKYYLIFVQRSGFYTSLGLIGMKSQKKIRGLWEPLTGTDLKWTSSTARKNIRK